MKAAIGCLVGLIFGVCASAEPVLEGRVRLASGEVIASAQVQVFDMTDLQRGAVAQATTDERGYFALPLAGLPGLVLPKRFELGSNYPNPFNPSTLIPYQLAASSYVRLEVFNLLGQRLATLVEGERPAGVHTAVWDATDGSGQAVGAGVYLYRLTVGGEHRTGRMVLVDGQAGVSAVGGEGVWPVGVAPDGSYGLVVSGSGIAPYVVADLGIQAGMAPMELVVAAHPAGKVLDDDDFSFDLSDLFNTPAAAAPDLVVSSASASDTTLTAGQAFTLQAKVRNQGDEPSSATVLRYYRSDDTTITSSDTEVGTDAIGALNPGATSGVLISLTAPAGAGTYYYGACVESVSGESDTDNNCSEVVTITVSSEDGEDGHTDDDGLVRIPDAKLRAAIVAALGKARGATITKAEMETLTTNLETRNAGISDLTGLEFATNLRVLDLAGHNLTDISALSGLTNLVWLSLNGLSDNAFRSIPTLSNISALRGLTNLSLLDIGNNQITDISALSGLTNLEKLFLLNNQITDISAQFGLDHLTHLFLEGNPLSASSINDHIPALQARGVEVTFEIPATTDATVTDDQRP